MAPKAQQRARAAPAAQPRAPASAPTRPEPPAQQEGTAQPPLQSSPPKPSLWQPGKLQLMLSQPCPSLSQSWAQMLEARRLWQWICDPLMRKPAAPAQTKVGKPLTPWHPSTAGMACPDPEQPLQPAQRRAQATAACNRRACHGRLHPVRLCPCVHGRHCVHSKHGRLSV